MLINVAQLLKWPVGTTRIHPIDPGQIQLDDQHLLRVAGDRVRLDRIPSGILVRGDRVYRLDGPAIVLGRSRQCDVVINDPNVSRRHAEVRREADGYVVVDLESTNGILVNGRGVKRVALADGDRLQLGTTSLSFETRPC